MFFLNFPISNAKFSMFFTKVSFKYDLKFVDLKFKEHPTPRPSPSVAPLNDEKKISNSFHN